MIGRAWQMQRCLNREIIASCNFMKRYPGCLLIWILIVTSPIILISFGALCNTVWKCAPHSDILIYVGVVIGFSVVAYIILPMVVAVLLNVCFPYRDNKLTQPPPPITRPPKHAKMKFSEYRSRSYSANV
jgi:hypothetical protein